MNYLDLFLAIPLIWAAYKGFSKGLVFSAASLLALILGIYGAIHFSWVAEISIQQWFDMDPRYLPFAAFTLTFLIIVILIHLISFVIDKLIRAVALGFVNRLGGLLFNTLKVAFILSVLISMVDYLGSMHSFIPEEQKERSLLYKPLSAFAPAVFPYLRIEELEKRYEDWNPQTKEVAYDPIDSSSGLSR